MAKRRNRNEDAGSDVDTPRKSRRVSQDGDTVTPTSNRSNLRGTPSKVNGTPSSLRKVLFSTVAGGKGDEHVEDSEGKSTSASASRNDRSAKRKSARHLLQQPDQDSEDEAAGEAALAQHILDDGDESLSVDEEGAGIIDGVDEDIVVAASNTPSKRGRGRPRGRPKRERTPTPPPDLPPHELYFFQNRTGANKTSSNILPTNLLLNHDDYLTNIRAYEDPHSHDLDRLKRLHSRSFDQWDFELHEGFNICLYGYGSKRALAMEFASHIYCSAPKPPKIVVVNGYTPELTVRDVLLTVISTLALPKSSSLPGQTPALLSFILARLTAHPPKIPLVLILHSLDAPPLRKAQFTLAQLASHPSISLVATADTPHFPLLFSTSIQRQYNFLFHDATTFRPYDVEIDVGEQVDLLLGRSGRGGRGKDGVVFVLRSLPENAKNLFNILIVQLLSMMEDGSITAEAVIDGDNDIDDDDDALGASDDEAAVAADTPSRRGRGRPKKSAGPRKAKHSNLAPQTVVGIEYRTLYHKAVEAFVCSSELNFRTLLKEFHDHRMVESHRDTAGVERLFVPGMGKAELEGLLEEIA